MSDAQANEAEKNVSRPPCTCLLPLPAPRFVDSHTRTHTDTQRRGMCEREKRGETVAATRGTIAVLYFFERKLTRYV